MIIRRANLYILTLVMAGFLAGCNPAVIQVGQPPAKMLQYPGTGIGKKIYLLPVSFSLEYDSAINPLCLSVPDDATQKELCQQLEMLSRKYLEQGGFEVIQLKELPEKSLPAVEKELAQISSCRREILNPLRSKDSIRESLSRLGQLAEVQTVVLVNAQIFIGSEPSLGQDESSTSIKAVVLSCQDGHQYWANEVFIRKRPKIEMLGQMMNVLFCAKPNGTK